MATCPKGHESTTLDYCDVCGALISGAARPSAAAPAGPAAPQEPVPGPPTPSPVEVRSCPVCGTPQTGRFCEEDGYDFLLAPPVTGTGPATATGAASTGAATATGTAPAGTATRQWTVVVRADSAYFEAVKAMGGEDAGPLSFPRFAPERRFVLTGEQMVIGRRSRSRGVTPDIDLAGPPEDPGVSHLHALLIAQQDSWAVVDLESANGTYLNDPSSSPIEANLPVPVEDGDKVYLGAWTVLLIHAT